MIGATEGVVLLAKRGALPVSDQCGSFVGIRVILVAIADHPQGPHLALVKDARGWNDLDFHPGTVVHRIALGERWSLHALIGQ